MILYKIKVNYHISCQSCLMPQFSDNVVPLKCLFQPNLGLIHEFRLATIHKISTLSITKPNNRKILYFRQNMIVSLTSYPFTSLASKLRVPHSKKISCVWNWGPILFLIQLAISKLFGLRSSLRKKHFLKLELLKYK